MEYFKDFLDDHNDENEFKPYRSEWRVFDEELKIAGSIDMLFENNKGELLIYDWKRCRNINKGDYNSNINKPLNPGLEDLLDTNYWHYTLQLNVYRWFLQTFYGLQIADLYLIVLHPENNNYRRFRLNILDDEVKDMLDCRKRAVESGSKQYVILPMPDSDKEEEQENKLLNQGKALFVDE